MKTTLLLVLLSVVRAFAGSSCVEAVLQSPAQDTLPVPSDVPDLLFYIQRDPNANTVCYVLNFNRDGALDIRSPIRIFWIKYAEKGERKELTYAQRKFAYGIKVRRQGADEYEITLNVCPKRLLYLRKGADGSFHIYTMISSRNCTLQRVFIRITGGTKLSPDVEYVELTGRDLQNGKAMAERIKVTV
ncbi:protein of unknown function [Dyadobacter sp. SG02]|uniref:DUF4833 domain-containing protein n=1 Tax=Dyadobacter sp. SG02 TaxID=1855291 RepID=UPI0008B7D73A|nr:DUF4833 domain-containing protein [Dyadobacter sp. SG02]SEJ59939.1 protein of unknown function [Dyadobacter sp. SG02]